MKLARNVYECMFLLDPNSYARDPAGSAQKIQNLVESSGGKVLASRLWNEQRLAYPINGQRKGVYWLIYFDLEGTAVPKFNRACQLADQVLRFLTIRIEPRLVEGMVAVAKGERAKPIVADAVALAADNGATPELEDQAIVGTEAGR
jgi:small subunit ribosomal protein S6